MKDYLTDRQQKVKVGGNISKCSKVESGVPQGSSISPLLFILYINDLIANTKAELTLFADDTHMYLEAEDMIILENNTQEEINKIKSWMDENKISLNPAKTQLLLINPSTKCTGNFKLHIGQNDLEIRNEAKYLGVHIDSTLSWNTHIQILCKKLSSAIGQMARLRTVLSNSALRSVYFAIFHQHLQYGIAAWGFTSAANLKRIDTLQRKAIRLLSRSKLSENLDPVHKALRIMKPSDVRDFEIAKFMHRLKSNRTSEVFAPLFQETDEVHNHGTRQSSQKKYYVNRPHLEITKKTISYTGRSIWNHISLNNRNLPYHSFKKQVINMTLEKYSD